MQAVDFNPSKTEQSTLKPLLKFLFTSALKGGSCIKFDFQRDALYVFAALKI
jgi:hypothetical protein